MLKGSTSNRIFKKLIYFIILKCILSETTIYDIIISYYIKVIIIINTSTIEVGLTTVELVWDCVSDMVERENEDEYKMNHKLTEQVSMAVVNF